MASTISGEIEMNLSQANAQIRTQQAELKKLRGELKGAQVDADKAGDSLNKQARRARSDLAVFGAQGRGIGQLVQGFTSLAGPVGAVGGAIMATGYAWQKLDEHMKDVISRGVEMQMMSREVSKSIHDDQAKIGTTAIGKAPDKASVGNIFQGIDPESFLNNQREKYGISRETAVSIAEAIGPTAKRKTGKNQSDYTENAYLAADIARVGGGVSAQDTASILKKSPGGMSDPFRKARDIIFEAKGVRLSDEEIKAAYEKNKASKEIQSEKKSNADAVRIEKGGLTDANISKGLTAAQEEKLLQNYRDTFSGTKVIEDKIRSQNTKLAKSKAEVLERRKLENTHDGSVWSNFKKDSWLGWNDIFEVFGRTPQENLQKTRKETTESEQQLKSQFMTESGGTEAQWKELLDLIRKTSEASKETSTSIRTGMGM